MFDAYVQETGVKVPPPPEPYSNNRIPFGPIWRCTYSAPGDSSSVRYFWADPNRSFWLRWYPADHPMRRLNIGETTPMCPTTLGGADAGPIPQLGNACGNGLRTNLIGYGNGLSHGFTPHHARDALVGRTLIYNPFYVEPAFLMKRQFTETELIESFGPITRTTAIEYSGYFYCRVVKGVKKCFSVAAEQKLGADYLEAELRPEPASMACKFQIHGAMQIVEGTPAPPAPILLYWQQSGAGRKKTGNSERPPSSEVFKRWRVPSGKAPSAEDAATIANFWSVIDAHPAYTATERQFSQANILKGAALFALLSWVFGDCSGGGGGGGDECKKWGCQLGRTLVNGSWCEPIGCKGLECLDQMKADCLIR